MKLANEKMAKSEMLLREYEAASIITDRPKMAMPMFDKENPSDGFPSKATEAARDANGVKPLQPLHNIYDRREKLLARLLNHRIGMAE